MRCAQGERRADSVEAEPDKACKTKKKRSKHCVINEWLGDVSDDDDDDYSDLKDFIDTTVVDQYDGLWETTEHPKDTQGWLELQAKVLKRKRE